MDCTQTKSKWEKEMKGKITYPCGCMHSYIKWDYYNDLCDKHYEEWYGFKKDEV